MNSVKIVVFVPQTHTKVVREAIGKAGAGIIGNYEHCSFSSKGIGAIKKVHPYEEVALDIYPLIEEGELE